MKTPLKILIVAVLAVVVVGAVALKKGKAPAEATAATAVVAPAVVAPVPTQEALATKAPPATEAAKAAPTPATKLPRLVDLGAGKCIPCKMMKPILDEMQRDYADRFVTEFIDVWENREAGKPYGIRVIPTQIFYDAEGKERFRHEGFYGREEILAKWKELGVDVSGKTAASGK